MTVGARLVALGLLCCSAGAGAEPAEAAARAPAPTAAGPGASSPSGTATVVPVGARTGLALTVYNDGRAMVRDARRLPLANGRNRLAFPEVAATIQPETAALRPLSGAPWRLLEQNFDFDLLTPESLLQHYVGRPVTVIHPALPGQPEVREEATVLAANPGGPVLRYADRIETGVDGRLAFASVPGELRERPTLSVLLDEARAGSQPAELAYLCGGIGWHADYVATLDAAAGRMDLAGWVTLNNQSGASFQDAHIQLVAGNVHRAEMPRPLADAAVPAMARLGSAAPQEERLLDYHLYTLGAPTTLLERQIKQVALLSAEAAPAQREYLLEARDDRGYFRASNETRKGLKPTVWLRFDNRAPALGLPLPAGVVRVYVRDTHGGSQLVGEDNLAHTAAGETVRLHLGEAFDLTADRVQTGFRVIGPHEVEVAFQIDVRNAASEDAELVVREHLPGDWRMQNESAPHVREDAGSARWTLRVPAEGSARLSYTARLKS